MHSSVTDWLVNNWLIHRLLAWLLDRYVSGFVHWKYAVEFSLYNFSIVPHSVQQPFTSHQRIKIDVLHVLYGVKLLDRCLFSGRFGSTGMSGSALFADFLTDIDMAPKTLGSVMTLHTEKQGGLKVSISGLVPVQTWSFDSNLIVTGSASSSCPAQPSQSGGWPVSPIEVMP